uniref:Variant surface glycoprotein 1125.4016 n=1 Tax=Trypanosoma brucei TaxID=5691 RepID=A0A1J0RA16_9TRYP|nr:variant surface glycoprotein 1125.4016 [Trypanosoma brucei]
MFLELALILMFAPNFSSSAAENAKEFKDMCRLYQLFSATVPERMIGNGGNSEPLSLRQAIQATMKELYQLNLTVISKTVEDLLSGKEPEGGWAKLKDNTVAKTYFGADADFEHIHTTYESLMSNENKQFRDELKIPLTELKRKKLRPLLQKLFSAAKSYEAAINSQNQIYNSKRAALHKALRAALYGSKYKALLAEADRKPETEPQVTTENFPWGAKDRDEACRDADGTEGMAGGALATDMVCLCTIKSGGTAITDLCSGSGDTKLKQIQNSGEKANALANFNALAAKCAATKNSASERPAPENLLAAAGNLFNHLSANSKTVATAATQAALTGQARYFLGVHVYNGATAPTCTSDNNAPTSTAGKGVCIDYKKVLNGEADFTWYNEMLDAVRESRSADEAFAQAARILERLHGIKTQMEAALLTVDLVAIPAVLAGPPGTSEQPSVEEQNKCKNVTNKTAEGCASVNCDYDDKEKKCKPKPGTENAAAGAGEGAAGANTETKKCTDKKKQEDCKSPDCKWESEFCKDSSFLVNKKYTDYCCLYGFYIFKTFLRNKRNFFLNFTKFKNILL